jgi:hypothetical protein
MRGASKLIFGVLLLPSSLEQGPGRDPAANRAFNVGAAGLGVAPALDRKGGGDWQEGGRTRQDRTWRHHCHCPLTAHTPRGGA